MERLQRSLAARDSLIQQLKMARLTDTPARQVLLLLSTWLVAQAGMRLWRASNHHASYLCPYS